VKGAISDASVASPIGPGSVPPRGRERLGPVIAFPAVRRTGADGTVLALGGHRRARRRRGAGGDAGGLLPQWAPNSTVPVSSSGSGSLESVNVPVISSLAMSPVKDSV